MPGKLSLNSTWNLDPLPATDEPSLAYLLLDIDLEGADASASTGAPANNSKLTTQNSKLNLSLVLDTSGSMAGAKLQNLKSAVKWVIDHLSQEDKLAITLFDDEVHPLTASTPVTDPKALIEKVDAIREAGGTAMSKGLLVGLDEAMQGSAPDTVSRIIVLTDGQTWGDAEKCKELAAQAGAAGIPITAMGVGADEDWSIELLDALAVESGGLSSYIARPEDISSAFEGTVLAMQQTVARNLRLTINPARGVEIRSAYRVAPLISRLWPGVGAPENAAQAQAEPQTDGSATTVTLPLGDIEAGGAQTLLVEVMLPPRRPGQYRLAHFLLRYEMTDRTGAQSDIALDVVATFTPGVMRTPGNPRVMNSVEKATTFKLQTRALQASMLGDVANATRNLRAAATRLLSLGETGLAEEAEKQAQLLETQGSMSAAGTKKLAFDTRRLALAEMENTKAATIKFEGEAELSQS